MQLNKTLLTTGIVAALTLVACGGDKLTGAKQAEATETRIRELVASNNSMFSTLYNHNASVKASYVVTEYKRGEQSSTAQNELTFQLNPEIFGAEMDDTPIILLENEQIDHADSLRKDKILARISSTYKLSPKTLDGFGVSPEARKDIDEVFAHLKGSTELLDDKKVKQQFEITPVNINKDDGHLKYDGFTITSNYTQPDPNSFLSEGSGEFKSGAFDFSSDDIRLAIAPITGTVQNHKDSYNAKFGTINVTFNNGQSDTAIAIDNTEFTASNISFDDATGQMLGKHNATLNNISISTVFNTLRLKQVTFDTALAKNSDKFDYSGGYTITPGNDLIKENTGISGLNINNITGSYQIKGLSTTSFNGLTALYTNVASIGKYANLSDKDLQTVAAGVNDIIANKNQADINLAIDTESGKAEAKITIGVKDNATPVASDTLDELMPKFFEQMHLTSDITIPVKIIQATGMASDFERYSSSYFKKEGDNYTSHIEADTSGVSVNGKRIMM